MKQKFSKKTIYILLISFFILILIVTLNKINKEFKKEIVGFLNTNLKTNLHIDQFSTLIPFSNKIRIRSKGITKSTNNNYFEFEKFIIKFDIIEIIRKKILHLDIKLVNPSLLLTKDLALENINKFEIKDTTQVTNRFKREKKIQKTRREIDILSFEIDNGKIDLYLKLKNKEKLEYIIKIIFISIKKNIDLKNIYNGNYIVEIKSKNNLISGKVNSFFKYDNKLKIIHSDNFKFESFNLFSNEIISGKWIFDIKEKEISTNLIFKNVSMDSLIPFHKNNFIYGKVFGNLNIKFNFRNYNLKSITGKCKMKINNGYLPKIHLEKYLLIFLKNKRRMIQSRGLDFKNLSTKMEFNMKKIFFNYLLIKTDYYNISSYNGEINKFESFNFKARISLFKNLLKRFKQYYGSSLSNTLSVFLKGDINKPKYIFQMN